MTKKQVTTRTTQSFTRQFNHRIHSIIPLPIIQRGIDFVKPPTQLMVVYYNRNWPELSTLLELTDISYGDFCLWGDSEETVLVIVVFYEWETVPYHVLAMISNGTVSHSYENDSKAIYSK